MRTITIALCCLFLHVGLSAQNVVVLRVSGQVQYYAQHGAKPLSMYPGMELELKGKVRCKGSASAKLLYKGSTFLVSGNKLRDVQDIVKAAVAASPMSFTGRFFSFVTESVKDGESQEKVQKHHRRYMSKTSAGIEHYAEKEFKIPALLLTTGKLPAATIIFKWRNTPGEGPYTFRLFEPKGKQIAQLLVRDTSVTLDLDQLAMDIFAEYKWDVTRGEGTKSAPTPFEVCPDKAKEVQAEIAQDPAFQSADPTEQQLMLAYSLEEERCFYSANNTYAHLLAADPDNVLLRKMYATFLARMNMLPEASALIPR
ncbi:MAG: hypothetical protein ACKVUS_00545 [Saprospiraceae bacterium]